MLTAALAFAAMAALITVTPGLDTMLVLRTTVTGGRRSGHLAALGITAGCLTWAVASAAGLTALLAASRTAFDVLRVAGACYLLWLGVQALRTAGRASEADEAAPRSAVRTGLVTNLLNPKIGVFYMSLLPQFVPAEAPVFWTSLLFALIHAVLGLLWFGLVVLAAGAARRALSRPAVMRRVQQITGLAFIAFGLRLATQH
ncbi:LysE family translocator [Actinomadura sp. 9N407]|uniref:LysE family translocator n=1 Tax=Actinomadura sp. 9N407 TaxID=3375154 RepID=UPI00379FD954